MAMAPAQDMPQDPAAAPSDAPVADDMGQGFCIEILCKSDGTFNVSVEPAQEEATEENATGETGEEGQPASSIQEALKIARQIFEAGGMADGGEGDFTKGYASNLDMGQ